MCTPYCEAHVEGTETQCGMFCWKQRNMADFQNNCLCLTSTQTEINTHSGDTRSQTVIVDTLSQMCNLCHCGGRNNHALCNLCIHHTQFFFFLFTLYITLMRSRVVKKMYILRYPREACRKNFGRQMFVLLYYYNTVLKNLLRFRFSLLF